MYKILRFFALFFISLNCWASSTNGVQKYMDEECQVWFNLATKEDGLTVQEWQDFLNLKTPLQLLDDEHRSEWKSSDFERVRIRIQNNWNNLSAKSKNELRLSQNQRNHFSLQFDINFIQSISAYHKNLFRQKITTNEFLDRTTMIHFIQEAYTEIEAKEENDIKETSPIANSVKDVEKAQYRASVTEILTQEQGWSLREVNTLFEEARGVFNEQNQKIVHEKGISKQWSRNFYYFVFCGMSVALFAFLLYKLRLNHWAGQ